MVQAKGDGATVFVRGPERMGTGPLNSKGPVPILSGPLVSGAAGDKKKGFPNTLGCFQVTFDYFRSNPGGTHMILWRWLGAFVFMAGMAVLLGGNLAVTAQDKDKGEAKKDDTAKKDEAKQETKKPDEPKKEAKKDEPKAEPNKAWPWKMFEPKTVTYQELDTNTTQDMKVMNQEISQKQKQTFYLKWTAEDKKDGNYVVTQEIIGLKMNINIGGNTISYDSTEEKQPQNPMSDFFKALLGMKLKLTISPQMKVVNVEGQEEFIKKLGGTNPQMEPLLKSILSKDALQQMAEPTWAALPTQDVAVGKSWSNSSTLNLGPIGSYATTFTYTYDGPDEKTKFDKISIKSELKYTKPDTKNGLPFTIKDATLSSKEGTGVALFDKANGRFAESSMKMKLVGDLTIEVGGMDTKVSLTQVQEATSRTTDQPPAALTPAKK
jgi:hypothetical protein